MFALSYKAINMAENTETDDLSAIRKWGKGWVEEETMALQFIAPFVISTILKTIVTAISHNGDSDSTSAVTGNLLGAHPGVSYRSG